MEKTVLIAMSGGVDSSVAAALMLDQGYTCAGAMMKLFDNADTCVSRERSCCSLDDAKDARAVAARLDIPFYVFNFTDRFRTEVMQRFAESYQKGHTPNPCIDCNRYVKFQHFLHRAREISYHYMATGHYAQIAYDSGSQRYLLKKGVDTEKDQSYVLYAMTQDQLAHTLLPLGGFNKQQVRELASTYGFINAQKKESQDICFVPDGDYASFIQGFTGSTPKSGHFVDTHGNILGNHKGIIHYTIGQRRGLGLSAPEPVYVCDIVPEENMVVVGTAKEVFSNTLTATDLNLIAFDRITAPLKAYAKVRYRHAEQAVTIHPVDENTLHLEFHTPQRAVTKGQAVVLYDGDVVLGGGTIA